MTPFQQQAELQALLVEALEVLIPSEVRSVPEATQYLDQIASRMRALAEEPEASMLHERDRERLESVRAYTKENGRLTKERNAARAEAEELRVHWSAAATKIRLLQEELAASHESANRARDKYEGLLLALTDAVGSPGCGGGNETGQELVEFLVRARDDARAALKSLPLDLARTTGERDAARAEVDELRKDRDAWVSECQSHVREKSELATQLEQARRDIQTKNDAFQCAVAAKDKALAEIAKLKAQCNNLGLKLVASDSEVERLKLAYISASAESDEAVACAQATVRNEVERLKQELSAARDALPEWAKRVMCEAVRMTCSGSQAPLCVSVRALTDDQRRQCLGEEE